MFGEQKKINIVIISLVDPYISTGAICSMQEVLALSESNDSKHELIHSSQSRTIRLAHQSMVQLGDAIVADIQAPIQTANRLQPLEFCQIQIRKILKLRPLQWLSFTQLYMYPP